MAAPLLVVVAAACGGENDDAPSDDLKREIADVLMDFGDAVGNGQIDDLANYWSETCSEAERSRQAQAAAIIRESFSDVLGEGEYALTIDAARLVVDEVSEDHVRVPSEQPDGVFQAAVGGRTPASGEGEALTSQAPLSLTREKGEWKIATCTLFTQEDNGAAPSPQR